MTDDYEVHEKAPTDEEGHPIHPEKGYRICGARKSDRTTPTNHGRERDDYAYCLQAAGWGTDHTIGACRNHPYTGSQFGERNPSYKHGAFSKHFRSDLTDDETDAFDDLVDALEDKEEAPSVIREIAAETLMKYKRSGDTRFLREARQLLDAFNIVPNADKLELDGLEALFMRDLREAHSDE